MAYAAGVKQPLTGYFKQADAHPLEGKIPRKIQNELKRQKKFLPNPLTAEEIEIVVRTLPQACQAQLLSHASCLGFQDR